MFGQIQGSLLAIPSVVNSPKWVSCDGIHLAIGDAFCLSRLQVVRGRGVMGMETITSSNRPIAKSRYEYETPQDTSGRNFVPKRDLRASVREHAIAFGTGQQFARGRAGRFRTTRRSVALLSAEGRLNP
jgi:hypothetical protein